MAIKNALPGAARIGRNSVRYPMLLVWPIIQQGQEPLNAGIFSYILGVNLGEKSESGKIRRFVIKENASIQHHHYYYYYYYYYIYNFDGYVKKLST
jgi:hypothetical protein